MLFMPNARNIIVRYNLSINDVNPVAGTSAKMINYTSTYSTNQIYNNTFYFTNTIPLFFQYTNTSSTFCFNSMFSNNVIMGGNITSFSANPLISTTAVFKNNCIYPQSINAKNGIPSSNLTIYRDPLLVKNDVSSVVNFKLQSASPCINAGVLISNNGGFDYFGNLVSSSTVPDIGFYQHVGEPYPEKYVVVYQNCSYGGWSVSLKAGSYTMDQLTALGVTTKSISSLTIAIGLKVTVYTGDNFSGSSAIYTSAQSCLSGTAFNDAISSIKIEAQ